VSIGWAWELVQPLYLWETAIDRVHQWARSVTYIYIIQRWTSGTSEPACRDPGGTLGHTGSTDVGLRSISTLTTVLAHQLLSELNSLMVLRWSETPTIDGTSFDTFEYTSEGLTRTGHGRETLGQTSGHHQTPPIGIPSFRNIHQLPGQLARCEQESSVDTHGEKERAPERLLFTFELMIFAVRMRRPLRAEMIGQ
jgi:hypothetical protein